MWNEAYTKLRRSSLEGHAHIAMTLLRAVKSIQDQLKSLDQIFGKTGESMDNGLEKIRRNMEKIIKRWAHQKIDFLLGNFQEYFEKGSVWECSTDNTAERKVTEIERRGTFDDTWKPHEKLMSTMLGIVEKTNGNDQLDATQNTAGAAATQNNPAGAAVNGGVRIVRADADLRHGWCAGQFRGHHQCGPC